MGKRTRILHVLMFNLLTALALCTTAMLLVVMHGLAPTFSFQRLGINLCVAYPVAVLLGLVFPSEKFGRWVCGKLRVKPGPLFGVVMTVSISLVYTVVLSSVMGFFNTVLLAHQGIGAFIGGFFRDFPLMLLASCLVSALFNFPVMRLAAKLAGEELPPRR